VSAAMFEARYQAEGDPWRTLSDPAERAKAEAVLAACGEGPFASVVDLGAGLGVLAAALAPRSRRLLALDAAPTAVAAAAGRLARWPGARAEVAVFPDDLPGGSFDLVVASEVLYYLAPVAFAATTKTWLSYARARLVSSSMVAARRSRRSWIACSRAAGDCGIASEPPAGPFT